MEKYETLGRRFLALIIDSILLGIVNVMLSFGAVLTSGNRALAFVMSASVNLLYVAYFILLHARYGQTVGKKIVSVKVVDDSEAPINFGQAVVRSLPQLIPALFAVTLLNRELELDRSTQVISVLISGAVGVFQVADIIVCLVNEKRRALHDFIAGTIVVRTDV
ncbi:MAG TPA: RDD family protein [Pyrinomonadaceae bacterium]|jgi:uncharacterized RDD family membrane protein YckC